LAEGVNLNRQIYKTTIQLINTVNSFESNSNMLRKTNTST